MTTSQKNIIDSKNESWLRSQISIMIAGNHKDKDEIIEYCEERLEKLNVDKAMAEDGEYNINEMFQ